MIDSVVLSHLVALMVGVIAGIAIALPWRPLIRRKIQTRNIADLSRALHEAIDELHRQDVERSANPYSGPLDVPA